MGSELRSKDNASAGYLHNIFFCVRGSNTRCKENCIYSRNHMHGFTLVEMLVVIGIIAILASLLMPSLTKAVETARTTSCASNMRQCNSAIMMYADDNNGMLPPASAIISGFARDWIPQIVVTRYSGIVLPTNSIIVGDIARCPTKSKIYGFNASPTTSSNFGLFPWNHSYRISTVTNASDVIVFADRSYVRGERWFRYNAWYFALAHSTGLNLLKLDGRVEYRNFPWLAPECELKDIPDTTMFSSSDFKRYK